MDLILQSASSMHKVIQYLSEFLYLHGPRLVLSMSAFSPNPDDAVDIHFDTQLKKPISQRQAIDNCLSTTHRTFKWLWAQTMR